MTWSSTKTTLECGCAGVGVWDETFPGDKQACRTHGETKVQRISRIYEARPSRDFRLGTTQEEQGVQGQQQVAVA